MSMDYLYVENAPKTWVPKLYKWFGKIVKITMFFKWRGKINAMEIA